MSDKRFVGTYKGPLGQPDAFLRIAVALERIAAALEPKPAPEAGGEGIVLEGNAFLEAYKASREASSRA